MADLAGRQAEAAFERAVEIGGGSRKPDRIGDALDAAAGEARQGKRSRARWRRSPSSQRPKVVCSAAKRDWMVRALQPSSCASLLDAEAGVCEVLADQCLDGRQVENAPDPRNPLRPSRRMRVRSAMTGLLIMPARPISPERIERHISRAWSSRCRPSSVWSWRWRC